MRSGRIYRSSLLIFVYIIVSSPQIFARTCESPFNSLTHQIFTDAVAELNTQTLEENSIIDPRQILLELNTGLEDKVSGMTDEELYFILGEQFSLWMNDPGYLPGHEPRVGPESLDDLIEILIITQRETSNNSFYDIYAQYYGSLEAFDNLLVTHINDRPLTSRNIDFINMVIEAKYITFLLEEFKRRFRDRKWSVFQDDSLRAQYLGSDRDLLGNQTHMLEDLLY